MHPRNPLSAQYSAKFFDKQFALESFALPWSGMACPDGEQADAVKTSMSACEAPIEDNPQPTTPPGWIGASLDGGRPGR
jgi:hypothetical protein